MSENERDQVIEEIIAEAAADETVREELATDSGEESAEETPPKTDSKSWLQTLYELMGNVALALIIVTVIFSFCFRQVVVDGASMNDTLAHGDRLLLQTVFYEVDHQDIVVIYQENQPEKPLIKRVIAMGGDSLRMDPYTNEVYLKRAAENDWELLDENYVNYPLGWGIEWAEGEVTVPEGHVFVMGDHRNYSKDSRDSSVGFVKEENIVGGVLFSLVPFKGV